jgi:glycosyltransferase involved in cell wall biosynthesis
MSAPVRFYGHFSGWSSYPTVCRAIAKWLVEEGVDLEIVNLRDEPVHGFDPEDHVVEAPEVFWREVHDAAREFTRSRKSSQVIREGVALVFGFPEWLYAVPRHEKLVGYHVCDYAENIPQRWVSAMGRADVVLTPSEHCREAFYSAGYEGAIAVVPHGIDGAFYPRAAERPNVVRHFCSSPSSDRKGTARLIEAWEAVEPKNWTLVIHMDQGPAPRTLLKSRGSIRYEFSAPREPDEMRGLYSSCSLLAAPSRAEGFGMMPLEALACGTPILATDSTGHGQWAHSVEEGAVWVEGDLSGLESKLSEAIGRIDSLLAGADERADDILSQWFWPEVLENSPLIDALR